MKLFVAGTSTEVGKTTVSRALLLRWRSTKARVLGIKPIETGVAEAPADAVALAMAAGDDSLVSHSAWIRERQPASPATARWVDDNRHADDGIEHTIGHIAEAVGSCLRDRNFEHVLVEGAGGLAVPVTRSETTLDLAQKLDFPIVLVGPDRLGVQSDVLLAAEVLKGRHMNLALVVLNRIDRADSKLRNRQVLARYLECPVVEFAPPGLADSELSGAAAPLVQKLAEGTWAGPV